MNEIPRNTLCEIISNYGTTILNDGRRCEGLLLDLCPLHYRENGVLIAALNEGIPDALLNSLLNSRIDLLLPRLSQQLISNLAVTQEESEWAVCSWAIALKVISSSDIAQIHKSESTHSNNKSRKSEKRELNKSKFDNPSRNVKQSASRKHSRANEIAALVISALAILVFLSLVSYDSNDWSFESASTQNTQNWVGVLGSVIADILFQTVGLTAYFLPILLSLVAWRSFRAANLTISIGRIIGYLFFIGSFSGLAALIGFQGGIVGAALTRLFASLLSNIGAGILLTTFLALSILIITTFSLDSFFGSFSLAWENFLLRFNEWFAKFKTQREENREAKAKIEKTPEVAVEKQMEEESWQAMRDETSIRKERESKALFHRGSDAELCGGQDTGGWRKPICRK